MDLRYYFVRRGCENIYNWTKDTFRIVTDATTQITYIEKVEDEQTKNHTEMDSEVITGYMPEIKGSKMCPVMSFTTYISALSPLSNYLWQSAKYNKFNYAEKIWYGPRRVGQNTLDSFITKLAEKTGMKEKGYSNHSLRVSGITNLTKNNFSNKQIMSISGHKKHWKFGYLPESQQWWKIKDGSHTWIQFGELSKTKKHLQPAQIENLDTDEPQAKRQCIEYEPENPIPSDNNALAICTSETKNNDFEASDYDLSDQDLLNLINDTANTVELTQYNAQTTTIVNDTTSVTKQQVVQKKQSPCPRPLFANCTFAGGVTININK